MINLAVEKAVGARRSEGSHRSVHRQYVRMRVRRDNEASAPYRRIRALDGISHGGYKRGTIVSVTPLIPASARGHQKG